MNELHIFTDGGARGNPGPAGLGFFVVDQEGTEIYQGKKFVGTATNNEAEYQAFLLSLTWLQKFLEQDHSPNKIYWYLDSNLVVQQILKQWKIKEPRMKKYAEKAWQRLEALALPYSITHVPREKNKEADRLVNEAIDESLRKL